MNSTEAAQRILTALHAVRETPLDVIDVVGAIDSDVGAGEGVEVPTEEECDRIAEGAGVHNVPPELADKFPSTTELLTTN